MTTHRSPVRQLTSFAAVGVACGLLFALQFLLLRFAGVPALVANTVATLSTAVAGSVADRCFSFGVRGSHARLRHLGLGVLLAVATVVVSSTALGLLALHKVALSTVEELAVVNVIGLITGIIRFHLLRRWVYRPGPPQAQHEWKSNAAIGQRIRAGQGPNSRSWGPEFSYVSYGLWARSIRLVRCGAVAVCRRRRTPALTSVVLVVVWGRPAYLEAVEKEGELGGAIGRDVRVR